MPKVSIIIPVYNAEKYLAVALDSVLSQSFRDIEVVCIDDGSSDSSPEILRSYRLQDDRVKVISQRNSGGSAARNTGLARARGEYVMFLDSDDMYADGIIKQAYEIAESQNVDVVFYNFARFVRKPTKLAVVNRNIPHGNPQNFTKETYSEGFFNDFAIITWNKLIRRTLLQEGSVLFDEKLSHNHDVDFCIRLMLEANSFAWLDRVGYYYRENSAGLTATKRNDPTNVLKILVKLNKQIAKQHPGLKESFDKYLVDMITGTVIKYGRNPEKVQLVFDYAREFVVPKITLSARTAYDHDVTGLYKILESGTFEELKRFMQRPRYRLRHAARRVYDFGQDIFARFPV